MHYDNERWLRRADLSIVITGRTAPVPVLAVVNARVVLGYWVGESA